MGDGEQAGRRRPEEAPTDSFAVLVSVAITGPSVVDLVALTVASGNEMSLGDRELDFDARFERREYAIKRAGWWCMLALIGLACLGLVGDGPLSSASATSTDGDVRVEFERLVRSGAVQTCRCEIAQAQGQVSIAINQAYLCRMREVEFMPTPLDSRSEGGFTIFTFAGSGAMTVELRARPRGAGPLHGDLRVRLAEQAHGDVPIAISQFVLP